MLLTFAFVFNVINMLRRTSFMNELLIHKLRVQNGLVGLQNQNQGSSQYEPTLLSV